MDLCKESSLSLEPLDKILASMPNAGFGELIPILQKIQVAYGYLPPSVMMAASDRTGIAASRIYGVATFYEQFHLEPHGRHTIKCCRGTACHVRGAPRVLEEVKRRLGVEEGETTEDLEYTLETVACIGCCALAPCMMINKDVHGRLTLKRVDEIFSLKRGGTKK